MAEHILDGDSLTLTFASWDAESYDLFLRSKRLPEHEIRYDDERDAYTIRTPARFAPLLGIALPRASREALPLAAGLWDYQAFLVRQALAAKRYAVWADTGLGKTLIELEWSRQVQHLTAGKVLLIYPLNLIPQVLRMARDFYGEQAPAVAILRTRDELAAWCRDGAAGLAITNPEKFIPRGGEETIAEITYCAGICLDESSVLKTGGGKIKWALIKSCRGVEYKLSCTATPAPNDPIEYASQASWLERIRDEGEVIWTFFVRDADGEWKVKEHALEAFYRFLSGWSCYLREPRRYGFANNLLDLPEPQRFEHVIPPTPEQLDYLQRIPDATGQTSLVEPASLGLSERARLAQLASGFLYAFDGSRRAERVPSYKPAFVADLVRRELGEGLQVLVWTLYDETVEVLCELLADLGCDLAVLTGSVNVSERPAVIEGFIEGRSRVLISRARMLGFGFNLQNVGSMIFADFNDSAEQIYQAERRAYRYGQTRSVRIHFPRIEELQGTVWSNVEAKRAGMARDVSTMERLYIEAMKPLLGSAA